MNVPWSPSRYVFNPQPERVPDKVPKAAIVAQISISAYSLSDTNQTHWVSRGFCIFSLVTSLMAVYYATTLHRIMGRQLEPSYVRAWIRGFRRPYGAMTDRKADPHRLEFESWNSTLDLVGALIDRSFRPAYASVITLSAPQVLLSTSLFGLLLGIGVYLGFMWTQHVDEVFGGLDSRNIWIVYLVTAVVCVIVYSTSRLITDDEAHNEFTIMSGYCSKWLESEAGIEALRNFGTSHTNTNTNGPPEASTVSAAGDV